MNIRNENLKRRNNAPLIEEETKHSKMRLKTVTNIANKEREAQSKNK
jgi:hypothetical protein